MVTRSKNGIFKPKAYTTTKHPLPPIVDYISTTYNQASKHSKWRLAMQNEYNALQSTGTWSLVPPSPSQNVVSCKWVFEINKRPNGFVEGIRLAWLPRVFTNKMEGAKPCYTPLGTTKLDHSGIPLSNPI